MSSHVKLTDIRTKIFLQEVHHFLWFKPRLSQGVIDHGWDCRGHAWVTALISHWLGHESMFLHGQAALVSGANKINRVHGIHQYDHTWVGVEDGLHFDLSIKSSEIVSGNTFKFPIKCVFASKWFPHGNGRVYSTSKLDEFERISHDLIERKGHNSVIYHVKEIEKIDIGHIKFTSGWINSPLTDDLEDKVGDPNELYWGLLLHLIGLLEGKSESMRSHPTMDAWRRIRDRKDNDFEQVIDVISRHRSLPEIDR